MRNSTIITIEAPRLRYLFHPDSDKPRYTAKPAAGIKASGTIHPAGMLIRAARGCSLPEIAAPPAKDIRHKQKIPIPGVVGRPDGRLQPAGRVPVEDDDVVPVLGANDAQRLGDLLVVDAQVAHVVRRGVAHARPPAGAQ